MLRSLVALALLCSPALACGSEAPFEAPELPAGRLLGLLSNERGTQFVWVSDTGSGRRLDWSAVPTRTDLSWPTGGSAATASHFSFHAQSGRLLFSGLLPLGANDEHFYCRPFELTLPSATDARATVELLPGAKAGPKVTRRCAYRWYGDGLLFRSGAGHWSTAPDGQETELSFGRDEDARGLTVHPGTRTVLETMRDDSLRVLDAEGQTLARLDLGPNSVTCIAHDASAFVLWDAQRGARLFELSGDTVTESTTLALAQTPEGKTETWAQCSFAPDGTWVAFSSNRQLGQRNNPFAGVSNPIRTLHAWEPSTGRVVLAMPGELEVSPFIWLPPAEER